MTLKQVVALVMSVGYVGLQVEVMCSTISGYRVTLGAGNHHGPLRDSVCFEVMVCVSTWDLV